MTDTTLHTTHTAWCTVEYPHWLEEIEVDEADLVLAFTQHDGRFRPNLVFTSTPHSGPISDAQVAAVHAAPLQHPGAELTGVDVWGSDQEGRKLSFLYPLDEEHDVLVTKWLWATGTQHVHVTASMLPFQWAWAAETLEHIVATLAFETPPQPQTPADSTEFALDAELSRASGFPLEQLTIRQGTEIPEGFPLSLEARELLDTATAPRLLRNARSEIPARSRGSVAAEQLARAGLIQAGTITDRGQGVTTVLREGSVVCELWMEFEGRTESLKLISNGRDAVISRTQGMGEPYPEGEVSLDTVAHEQILRWLIAWIDLPPRYLVSESTICSEQYIDQHLHRPLNDGGWRKITVSVPGEVNFAVIETDTGGVFIGSEHTHPGEVALEPFSPSQVFEQIISGLSAKLLDEQSYGRGG